MAPRRSIPPPPPRHGSADSHAEHASTSHPSPSDQPSGRHPLGISPPPPPPPRRRTSAFISTAAYLPTPETEIDDEQTLGLSSATTARPRPTRRRTVDEIELQDPELGRLLRRPPPPPPISIVTQQKKDGPPPLPSNRPSRAALPTPPPEPEVEAEPLYYEEQQESISTTSPACLKCRDFSVVDAHAAQFPRQSVQTLQQLAYDLCSPFATEMDKFRAIFTWLHHNIDYDAASYFAGTVRAMSPLETLRAGLAVCDGYAGLLEHLAELSGLTAHKVVGHGKGVGFTPLPPGSAAPEEYTTHAWNCCYMDGAWQLVDSCWGAGSLNGSAFERRFAPQWFSMTPLEFVQRHFPTDRSFQLIGEEDGGVVEWKDYILAAPGPQLYRDFHELNLHGDTVQPGTKEVHAGTTATFCVWKRCEHMSTAEEDNYIYVVATADGERVPMERNDSGGWSASAYVPSGGDVSLYAVTTMTERTLLGGATEVDAHGCSLKAYRNAVGKKGMSFKFLVKWTVL